MEGPNNRDSRFLDPAAAHAQGGVTMWLNVSRHGAGRKPKMVAMEVVDSADARLLCMAGKFKHGWISNLMISKKAALEEKEHGSLNIQLSIPTFFSITVYSDTV